MVELANSINELTVLTSKTRTLLWCALQISNVNYKQPVMVNGNLSSNESLLNNLTNTKEFIKKTFQIQTDLPNDLTV